MPSMTERKCKHCGKTFMARTADVKRGWAQFHSKSCKALHQEKRTGQCAQYFHRKSAHDGGPQEFCDAHLFSNEE